MATVTITNLTGNVVLLQELYRNVRPYESFTIEREEDQLHAMPELQQKWFDGVIEVVVSKDAAEESFINAKLHGTLATRIYHEPTVSAAVGTNAPGQQPSIIPIGSVLTAAFTIGADKAYRIFKIPGNFVSTPAFHVHWTKSSDAVETGNTVRWRLSYTVFPGNGADVNVSPTVINFDDTYDDSGTTSRIIYKTPDIAAIGFLPNYYIGIAIEAVAPLSGTPLTSEPALASVDLTYIEYINQ